jgi:hypothetical protein
MDRHLAEQPESLELVLSSGLLRVAGEERPLVRVHLLTQAVHLEHDRETGAIRCLLAEASQVRLEDDEIIGDFGFFDKSAAPGLREKLAGSVTSPVDPAVVGFLKDWAERALDTQCEVTDQWEPRTAGAFRLDIAPALVLRRRDAFALRQYYENIVSELQKPDAAVPLGLAQLVETIEPSDKLAWLERTGAMAAADLAEDPLFPLPANDQQRDIIRRLGDDSGVVVEGPPGTGKTHTIANLMSALLARGQRILVTSEKAQALAVLRDKLPEQMQDLCVAQTDLSGTGKNPLASSVSSLSDRHSDFRADESQRRIAELKERRAAVRRQRSEALERIRALRESEWYQHPEIAPGYSGTLAEIVRKINATDDVGWIRSTATGECPLTTAEFGELLNLLRAQTDRRIARRNERIPEAGQLPTTESLGQWTAAIATGDAVVSGEGGDLVSALGDLPDERLRQLGHSCRTAAEAVSQLRFVSAHTTWAEQVANALLAGQSHHLWQGATAQLALIDVAVAGDRAAGYQEVSVGQLSGIEVSVGQLSGIAAASAFATFADYLRDGGKIRKLAKKPEQKAVEPYLDSVRVAGAAVNTAEAADTVAQHLRVLDIAGILRAAFAPLGYVLPADAHRGLIVDQLAQLRVSCDRVQAVLQVRAHLAQLLASIPPSARPRLSTVQEIERFAGITLGAEKAKLARAELTAATERAGALVPAQWRATEHESLVAALAEADVARYQSGLRALELARIEQRDQGRCDELRTRLAAASAGLADELAAEPHAGH